MRATKPANICHLDSTRHHHRSEVLICTDSPAQLHKLDRLFVHLDGCSNSEWHVPPPFICKHMISVFASDNVSPNAALAVTITVIVFSGRSGGRDTMPASSAYSIPDSVWVASPFLCPSTFPVRALPLLFPPFLLSSELHHAVHDDCISGEAFLRHAQHRGEKNVEHPWREHTSSPKTLLHIERIRALAINQSHACPHAVVQLADDGEHSRWNAEASQGSPRESATRYQVYGT